MWVTYLPGAFYFYILALKSRALCFFSAVIRERQSRAPQWSAGPMPCFAQLKLNLHWRGPRWSAGPVRCRAKACHSTRGLVSALTRFGSMLQVQLELLTRSSSAGSDIRPRHPDV